MVVIFAKIDRAMTRRGKNDPVCAGLERPMSRYEINIYWSQADDAFVAEVPELPGCAAEGKTHKEALSNVEVIIQEWMETAKELGRPIPTPRGRLAFA
jgi:predicted RNase H-like HicB family nuclease